jgi:hypothetical protein
VQLALVLWPMPDVEQLQVWRQRQVSSRLPSWRRELAGWLVWVVVQLLTRVLEQWPMWGEQQQVS